MEAMYAGPLRQARALTLSGACVALSMLAHLAGGGWVTGSTTGGLTPASVCGLLALTTLTALAVGAASGRRWSFGRAVLALAVSQAGLHLAFGWLLPGHDHAGMAMPGPAPSGWAMAAAHTGAGLAVAGLVAVADRSLATVEAVRAGWSARRRGAAWLRASLARLLLARPAAEPRLPDPLTQGPWTGWTRPRIRADLVVLQGVSRRGPPARV
ncbi:hypothetical protein [Oryzihumus sp.]|uniref:hypothetical protein n=1 Tax=Oryzihumus sp. TaxID=1968903 RepID=UPI002ED8678E